jgi:hypothetical protein
MHGKNILKWALKMMAWESEATVAKSVEQKGNETLCTISGEGFLKHLHYISIRILLHEFSLHVIPNVYILSKL